MAKLKFSFPTYQQPKLVTYGKKALSVLADCDEWESTAIFLSGEKKVQVATTSCLRHKDREVAEYQVIVKPPGEPTLEMVKRGAEFLEHRDFSRIVAIGGGSVMDWCRLAWAWKENILSLDGEKAHVGEFSGAKPELILIPTTCATGAEAASVVVFNHNGAKVPVVSQHFLADRVILDGQFVDTIEAGLLSCFLCDALSHAIESYVSIVPCVLAKQAANAALWLILDNYKKNNECSTSDRLMEAAYFGGLAATHCSVGVVHAFAHSMANYGFSHSMGNAIGLLAGINTNADVPAMHEIATRCGLSGVKGLRMAISPIVHQATEKQDGDKLISVLTDISSRQDVVRRMESDVCLRTNPKRLETADCEHFLDVVLENFRCR